MNDNLCCICRSNQPDFICFCTESMFCGQCISAHLLAAPSLDHKPVPLTAAEFVQALQHNSFTLTPSAPGEAEIKRNKETLTKELNRLQAFLTNALQQLQAMRKNWEDQIARVTEDYARLVTDEVGKVASQIQRCIQDMDDFAQKPWLETPMYKHLVALKPEEDLLTLSLAVRPVNIAGLFKQVVSFLVSFEAHKSEQRMLYKFFGGMNVVGTFDPQVETHAQQSAANMKFLHNSCWSVTDNGSVFITGGSQTGKSRNDVLLFQPLQNSVNTLEPMLVARRSHASVCVGAYGYVFGGILEEEPLSLSEVYSMRERRWASLPHMKERRAYLGCCQFRGSIFVCGGGDSASMEVFRIDNCTFQHIPMPTTEVWDNVSLIAIEDYLLIFHGNFQGEVSRYYPLTSQLTKSAQVCYGNSWSSCQPVLYRESVYMLRSDSIFKFDISSSSSSYILRLSKTLKKAEDE